ncbi:TFIIA-alpha and beta-like factor [Salarias fasciatus]|uniref:TFIIA-alpha and beta-like factor n=1 Tax=Salarias fasciatus TaxID=181472 RepID=UPI0011767A74|nr:TFIIA-alpha and beta-like factor [Salarias fasciatus]
MLKNASPVAKLYLSIIDDVIDNMRELFFDEGLEDRVLDDLKHLWKSKLMQSKAMEDLRKNSVNLSNFVLQLPASYNPPDQDLSASVLISANQNVHYQANNNSEALATFSLPAGLTYPVQIPAGVTLQTASGQLYKVNVPVVVTQAPGSQQPAPQPTQKATEMRKAPAPQPAAVPPNPILPLEGEPSSVPASSVTQPVAGLPPIQDAGVCQHSPEPEVALAENESGPQTEPINLSRSGSPRTQLDYQIRAEEALMQSAQSRDIEDILKEVIEKERERADRARSQGPLMDGQLDSALGLDLNYNVLSDIIQLDGPADNSDLEEVVVEEEEEEEEKERPRLEETDFLSLISAEAIRALQEEKDPLNSGDDVIEQDIPDLFDTDNVIVCQYDKIHRTKNRWKFHLKDGVMCYGGQEHVFSKAIGEAEW